MKLTMLSLDNKMRKLLGLQEFKMMRQGHRNLPWTLLKSSRTTPARKGRVSASPTKVAQLTAGQPVSLYKRELPCCRPFARRRSQCTDLLSSLLGKYLLLTLCYLFTFAIFVLICEL